MGYNGQLIFDKNSFFIQLIKHRVMKEENPEKYLNPNDGTPIVAPSLRLLDKSVYRACFEKITDVEKLKNFPNYKDLIIKWQGLISTEDEKGRSSHSIKIYALEPVYSDSIRSNYYDEWKSNKNLKMQLEFVISFCLACGVDDPRYIHDAIDAFCDESLDGKGLRKILLQGAMMGCWKFGDIAYDGRKTGLMESYYEQFLTNPDNGRVTDFLESVISGASGEGISSELESGTTLFVKMAAQCANAVDFVRLLENPVIQRGALSDLIDTTCLVKGFIAKREKTLNCKASSYAAKYGVQRSTYSDFTHGRCGRTPFVFLRLAVIFGFTQEEFDLMIHSMHIIGERIYGFNLCSDGAREICGFDRQSQEYRNACAGLMEKIRSEADFNADDLPTNTTVRSFYNVLMKIKDIK